ncbi:MAG TPA: VOC family protein [Polyangiaceae bacterium]|nr:VOC family protein [Polyangiaceae bacterium]
MPALAPLGIKRIEALHYYVRDLERSRRFYTEKLDFAEVGESGAELVEGGHQRALVFEAGGCRVICSTPLGVGGRAHRYLQKHPDGIGSLILEVEDIETAFGLLEGRGGTPVHDIVTTETTEGVIKTFLITTPFGDTTFRFVERHGKSVLYPGFVRFPAPRGGRNAFGFSHFDHVTANFETMAPALLWLEHVLGFERFWQVEFHTDDVTHHVDEHGSGLRSVVMWDRASGVKFANNEPYRPNFKASQINVFHEENRGDGVQHVALAVRDVLSAVRGLRGRGVEFMPAPAAYYRALPQRLATTGVGAIREPVAELEELGLLVDGDGPGRYLLQIFLKDSAGIHDAPEAGPFFYELIERRGDQGFGAGNFRALFESIEQTQNPGGSG